MSKQQIDNLEIDNLKDFKDRIGVAVSSHFKQPNSTNNDFISSLDKIKDDALEKNAKISYGFAINEKDTEGKTPLCYAVENELYKAVDWLTSNGANINKSPKYTNYLKEKIINDRDLVFLSKNKLILKKLDNHGDLFRHTIEGKNAAAFSFLLDEGFKFLDENESSKNLHTMEARTHENFRSLLKPLDENESSKNLLQYILSIAKDTENHKEFIEPFLKAISKKFDKAPKSDKAPDKKIKFLNELDSEGRALKFDKAPDKKIKFLNELDSEGRAPLCYAVQNRLCPEVVKFLITEGADPYKSLEHLELGYRGGMYKEIIEGLRRPSPSPRTAYTSSKEEEICKPCSIS